MIKIGDIDIGKVIIELQFQSKLNSLLIENILNKQPVNRDIIEQLKVKAAKSVNDSYGGKQMITYTPPINKEEKQEPESSEEGAEEKST